MMFREFSRILKIAGRKSSTALIGFVLFFSGLGYFFVNKQNSIAYFDKKIVISNRITRALFNNNLQNFLLHFGKVVIAENHCIQVNENQISLDIQKQFPKDEDYQSFLKTNDISDQEYRQYIKETHIIKKFYRFFPQRDFNLDFSKNRVQNIEGSLFVLKKDYLDSQLNEIIQDFSNEDLKQFAFNLYKTENKFTLGEKRSGIIIEVDLHEQDKNCYITKDQYDIFVEKYQINEENALSFLRSFVPNSNVTIHKYVGEELKGEKSDYLFMDSQCYKEANKIYVPFVQKISPSTFDSSVLENLDQVKTQFRVFLQTKMGSVITTNLSHKYNLGQIQLEELKEIADVYEVSYDSDDGFYRFLKFASLEEGKASSYVNSKSQSSIFLCRKKHFADNTSLEENINMLKTIYSDLDVLSSLELENRLIAWINFFSEQQ